MPQPYDWSKLYGPPCGDNKRDFCAAAGGEPHWHHPDIDPGRIYFVPRPDQPAAGEPDVLLRGDGPDRDVSGADPQNPYGGGPFGDTYTPSCHCGAELHPNHVCREPVTVSDPGYSSPHPCGTCAHTRQDASDYPDQEHPYSVRYDLGPVEHYHGYWTYAGEYAGRTD